MVSVDYNELGSWVDRQAANTPDTPYDVLLTGLSNVTTLNANFFTEIFEVPRRKVYFNLTIEDGPKYIGNGTFAHNTRHIVGITLPRSVIQINGNAFYDTSNNRGCSSLTHLIAPGVKYLLDSALAYLNCDSVQLPALEQIGNLGFYFATIKDISIPASVTTIGTTVFNKARVTNLVFEPGFNLDVKLYDYNNKASFVNVTIPSSIRNITNMKFTSNDTLETIRVGEGTLTIGQSFCSNCAKLVEVDLPDSLIELPMSAFAKCTSLSSFVVPNSVERIYASTFSDCTSLISESEPTYLSTSSGKKWLVSQKGITSDFILDPSTIGIADNGSSTSVSLELDLSKYNLKYIGEKAFYNYKGITKLYLPKTVTYIGENAFAGTSSLTDIKIYAKVSDIVTYNGCLSGISNVARIYVPFTNYGGWKSIEPTVYGLSSTDMFYTSYTPIAWVRIA